MKIINMDAGLSLRLLMAENDLQGNKLASDLGVSENTISVLRRGKLMSGSNMAMLCRYFLVSPSNFIRKGETSNGGE